MHARPYRRKVFRDLRSHFIFAAVRPRLARWEHERPQRVSGADTGQFAKNWLSDNLPNNFRQIVFHDRQIVPYPVFAPAKRLN